MLLVLGDEVFCAFEEYFGHGFVVPCCGLSATTKTDTPDTVDDRIVVLLVAVLHGQQLRVVFASRDFGERVFAAVDDRDRIVRVEVVNDTPVDKHAGHAVVGRCHDIGLIKAYVERARADLAVPVNGSISEADVPFADDGRLIACCAQCAGEGAFVLADNHRRIAR